MSHLSAQPPPAMIELRAWILDSPTQLKLLRSALNEALYGESEAPEALDGVPEKMVLVATELATNALRHGFPPTTIRLGRAGDRFVLDVTDQNPGEIPEYAEDRALGRGGLGLQLARDFSLEIGWYIVGETKHVWAEFPVAGEDD